MGQRRSEDMTTFRNQIKTVLLLGALSALVIGIGGLVAPGHLYLFGALALLMNLGAYFFSDRIVLRMHRAQEVRPAQAPELHSMVAELSARAAIPQPRVFLIPDPQPNAFATGRNPAHGVVAVTEGILRTLDRRELRGVIAHEIAHIRNRDILVSSVAAAGASLISWVANALSFGALFGGSSNRDDEGASPAGGLLVALVAPMAATLIQLGISRSREYMADATGAELSGDPEALASALIQLQQAAEIVPAAEGATPATASLFIVNPFGGVEGLSHWFSTHPSTAERVRRLRELARTMARRGPGVRTGPWGLRSAGGF
jgi:heat shock protein HtpX